MPIFTYPLFVPILMLTRLIYIILMAGNKVNNKVKKIPEEKYLKSILFFQYSKCR